VTRPVREMPNINGAASVATKALQFSVALSAGDQPEQPDGPSMGRQDLKAMAR
jgi:hypothetical protein